MPSPPLSMKPWVMRPTLWNDINMYLGSFQESHSHFPTPPFLQGRNIPAHTVGYRVVGGGGSHKSMDRQYHSLDAPFHWNRL